MAKPSSATGSRATDRAIPASPNERAVGSGEPDPGIQEAIEQVHEDIDDDEEHGDDEHAALHQRVVALDDRGQQHPSDAGDGEDLLDHDRSTEQLSGLDAEERDDHDEP